MVSTPHLDPNSPQIAILTGATATGKSKIAFDYALDKKNIEIVNADSILVYQDMNVGSAKPPPLERNQVRHHLIDIRLPNEPYTAGEFTRDVQKAVKSIHERGKRALIVGGTGFYLKALLYGLWQAGPADPHYRDKLDAQPDSELYQMLFEKDEESALRIGANDRYRLIRALEIIHNSGITPTEHQKQMPKEKNPQLRLLVIDRDNSELFPRIIARTEQMLARGFVGEVKMLKERYGNIRALRAVGYQQVLDFIEGRVPEGRKLEPGIEGLKNEIVLATRQLVKRQRTWFRGEKSSEHFHLDDDLEKLTATLDEIYVKE